MMSVQCFVAIDLRVGLRGQFVAGVVVHVPGVIELLHTLRMSMKCTSCGDWLVDVTSITESYQRLACANAHCPSKEPPADSIGMSQRFGARLVEVLGLSGQKVSSIRLDFESGEPVMLTVRRFATYGQAQALAQLLEEFEVSLVAKPGSLREEPLPTGRGCEP